MEKETRIIKKYPNRRLYDTKNSCYINLGQIKTLIEKGVPIKVIDRQTEQDITRSILLQIIMEQESNQQPLFSTESLEKFIRYYEDSSREGFMHFMDKNIQFFHEQQDLLTKQMQDLMAFNPLEFWSQTTNKNLEAWKNLQQNFLKSATGFGQSKETSKDDSDN
ncbi:MAG: polyhydroxyalkanoate synthesis repressor PhaR [Gammaproteobacteria bacterium]|nr:polyhydroxyalkanoate synthesis repressor PhaR [Gammaproteobacteria bacterium]